MKKLFLSFLVGAVVAMPVALLADDLAGTAPASGNAVGAGADGQRMEKARAAFEKLDLTDAQKAQIKQIRANTPAGKERRQQIMAVLTPDQKAKLIAMLKERHDGDQ
jgi:Spy/CpxP family protein refolding chaperone